MKEQKRTNAVIYARYSSHGQTEQSIEGQLHDNYAWAERQGITVIGEYIDRALSGTTDRRPNFQRMIADAAKREFQLVIVWKLDRFARNRYDSAIYKAKLKKCGVKVVSVKENIPDGPEGVILEGMLESMAEYYSASLSQTVRRGLRESAEKGNYCGGPVPYGHKIVDHRLVADEVTAPIIRYLFEEYAKGTPRKAIIAELNRRGVRNSSGKPLTNTSFQHTLRMTTYIGEYPYNGKTVLCAEPLVSGEVFEKVQAHMDAHARAPGAAKAKVPYLLQGKIFYGKCGAAMCGESGKSHNGKLYTYYCCSNQKQKKSCDKKNERRDRIETYVIEQIMEYIFAPDNKNRIAKAVVREYENEDYARRIGEAEKALAKIESELNKLVDVLIDAPKTARSRICTRMEELEAQKAGFETDVAMLRTTMSRHITEEDVISWLEAFRDGNLVDFNFCRDLIDALIESVYVYDGKIIVHYNIRNGKLVSDKDKEVCEFQEGAVSER